MNQSHLIATILFGIVLRTNAFSYKDAKNWGKKYPKCNGPYQSPISFEPTGQNGFPSISKELILTGFNKTPKKMTMKNTGHTVEIKADWNGKSPSCTGGPLRRKYIFEKATFHWAKKPVMYPNPIHWLDEMSKTLNKVRSPNSTAEIKPFSLLNSFNNHHFPLVFYEGSLDYPPCSESVTWFILEGGMPVIDSVVRSPNSTAEIKLFPLLNCFDNGYTPFLFYEGSLDYPPCSESVTWFIVEAGIPVIDSVVKEFKKVKLAEGDVSNVRPTQPLNKRQVKYVYNHNKHL
ncbi:carbonic anhydrase 7-like [Belonocnema kinseyi]|uniref:carbonic anhydrase 7-like n=1 Tax=Belonocnema kinseyi TaxID=2817044 RepID=UPI00143CED82|nr:carbonic anhydrase 7-like [Belonocnema kinseyi]